MQERNSNSLCACVVFVGNEGETEDQAEGGSTEDGGVAVTMEAAAGCDVPVIVVEETPAEVQRSSVPPEFTEGNDAIKRELVANSIMKRRLQKRRLMDVGGMQPDDNLLSQEMFVSIHGNQFRRNGMGSFGTFQY